MTLLERVLHHFFPRAGKALAVIHTLFIKRALWESMRTGIPLDGHGQPAPWITFPALDYLSRLDFSQAHVLEYGGGQSSLWWAARAKTVTTVEGRKEWAERIRRNAPGNLSLIGPVEGLDYVESPLKGGLMFEVIVIDGFLRLECARAALPFLVEHGLLILDNSDWNAPACRWLREQGMMQIDFHGFGPVNDYTWCTSVFTRRQSAVPHRGDPWTEAVYGNLVQPA
ncbi:O-methyltransferase [Prosthecobacter vanneervenii]|uniref:Uncharacterized protein n=1 Tax=Prosthecobacter vanneervenii TaxID=48466 RepID=A0A7W7Y6D0_9BACT|nr:hypothetical protein [Prosthecobacter vanneervenii]MBB5030458.1 hypothetical protein [Prosthecobacter vanneervenii]